MSKSKIQIKLQQQYRRARRVRAKITGTAQRPRLSVFRSSKHTYGSLIDDERQKTLLTISDKKTGRSRLKKSSKDGGNTKVQRAFELGQEIAREAGQLKIKKVVFDRGRYRYHGRVKALAEGARAGGLVF